MGGVDCCVTDKSIDPDTQKEIKKETIVNFDDNTLREGELHKGNEPRKLEKNDVRVSKLEKKIDFALNDKEIGLHDFFKGLKPGLEELKDSDNYLYEEDLIEKVDATYKGTFKSDNSQKVRHGFGALLSGYGNLYIGQWSDHMPNGKGLYLSNIEVWYKGSFSSNNLNGFGIIKKNDEFFYEGNILGNLKSGQGKETYTQGGSYEGEYYKDMKSGKGKFSFPDGSLYEGGLLNDEISGYGIYKWHDGKVYEGYWKEGKMHTIKDQVSTFTWIDNRKYVGEYKNDKKEGRGRFTFPNGVVYDGEWHNGKKHGKGTLLYFDENGEETKKYNAIWKDGVRLTS